jgi:hypothetical protein
LSIQNQTIHVYNIVKMAGNKIKFLFINSIGRFAFADDSDFINKSLLDPKTAKKCSSSSHTTRLNSSPNNSTRLNNFAHLPKHPFAETSFTSIKHRIISFFYREALQSNSLSQFYANLKSILNLKMYRMQLLVFEYLLLLKF